MKHIIALLLENEPGALSRVVGLFSARGYNIESLTVAPTEDPSLSRMTIVTTGSDEIMPGSYFTLDSLGETLLAFGNTYLQIEGNTDSRGNEAANKTLSQKRAESVKEYLVKNFNVDPKRFVTIGEGSSKPVADNATEDGRALNRRTDIKVVLNAQ